VRVDLADQPKLFSTINKVAVMAGRRAPDEVYLTSKLKASIAWKGGITGLRKPLMFIGLLLFQVYTVAVRGSAGA
jgi:hypothetical protein